MKTTRGNVSVAVSPLFDEDVFVHDEPEYGQTVGRNGYSSNGEDVVSGGTVSCAARGE